MALLTDPPYHLTSIVKRFGASGAKPATEGVYARGSRGFMGKRWDGGDLAFQPDTWAALGELLHPGAFGMAFSGSRGWHRMAVAIEDAGMVIHPSIFGWLYGSGFPKATRVKGDAAFDGHRYGLQALKPALEPIIVFQKPYTGKPVDSITRTGAGALNVEQARISGQPRNPGFVGPDSDGIWGNTDNANLVGYESPAGRWPANFALVCLPSCNGEHAPGCPVAALDAQSGERGNGAFPKRINGKSPIAFRSDEEREQRLEMADTGTASRFFHRAAWELEHADPVLYQAKASRSERDAGLSERCPHPTVKPIALSRWLATLLLSPPEYAPRRLLVPFAGVASEMIGAGLAGWDEIVGVEGEAEYAAIGRARLAHWLAQLELVR